MKAAQEEPCPYGTTCWPRATRSFAPEGQNTLGPPPQCLGIDDHKEDGQGRPSATPASGRWVYLGGPVLRKLNTSKPARPSFLKLSPGVSQLSTSRPQCFNGTPIHYTFIRTLALLFTWGDLYFKS